MLNELHDQDEERAMLEAELNRLERCIAQIAADMMEPKPVPFEPIDDLPFAPGDDAPF